MSKEIKIEPIFSDQSKINVAISFACDNNYAPYLSVVLQSLIENSSTNNNYDIVVLETNISQEYKDIMLKQIKPYHNISLRFFDVSSIIAPYKHLLYTRLYFTESTYYRLFVTKIFASYEKVLYLDTDIIILADVAELYNTSINDKLIAAIIDRPNALFKIKDPNIIRYYTKKLKLKHINTYIQAGVVLFNIKALTNFNFLEKSLQTLKIVKKPQWVDQDIMNAVLEGNIYFLDITWNYMWTFENSIITDKSPEKIKQDIIKTEGRAIDDIKRTAKIIHYSSHNKPWNSTLNTLSVYFWQYARRSPFYEKILLKLTAS